MSKLYFKSSNNFEKMKVRTSDVVVVVVLEMNRTTRT